MRIMVFDVPAESGGALSVLYDFYDEYKLDQKNEYFFVVSLPELEETNNIKVLRFPWIKKSWIHRLYFEHFVAPFLTKKYKIDKILSLQNIMISHIKTYQSVFVHNDLPFSEHRFSFIEDKLLWIYQNIIGRKIKKSIMKSDKVIVQTNWMKEKFVNQLNVNREKIEVKSPNINIEITEQFQKTKESLSTFFYPASGIIFKNHKVIVESCIKLKEDGLNDYKVILTLNGDENRYISNLYNTIKNNHLPIEFIGSISREEVFQYYSKSILIFPSLIETYGLPLLEAKMHNSPIIVFEQPFSMEILSDYKYVNFVPVLGSDEFSKVMKKYIVGEDV